MKIAVIGLGKIGLPLAVQFAGERPRRRRRRRRRRRVAVVNARPEPFPGEAELAERLAAWSGRTLLATTDNAAAVPQATS